MEIDIRNLPLTFEFNKYDNSYEVRDNRGFLIKALKNDYVATRYLIETLCISKEAAERIVECTFLAGLRNNDKENRL